MEGLANNAVPFGELHQALVTGDSVSFQILLDQNTSKVTATLNSLVTYNKTLEDGKLNFELPLALAACSGNVDMFTTVIEQISDKSQQDTRGNNIIHCLVMLADDHPVLACHMYNTLMSQTTDPDTRLKLLSSENSQKHTALSLAGELCIPEMIQCILQTDGVFRFEFDLSDCLVCRNNQFYWWYCIFTLHTEMNIIFCSCKKTQYSYLNVVYKFENHFIYVRPAVYNTNINVHLCSCNADAEASISLYGCQLLHNVETM